MTSLVETLLAVTQTGPDEFTTVHHPRTIGNPPPIAYGGCTLGAAVLSAYETIPSPTFHIFSLLGSFHGFTRNDRSIICRVTRTRDTRTFATRRVAACQKQDDGTERICAEIFIDFHVLEEDELMRFSAPPFRDYGDDPEDNNKSAPGSEIAARMVQQGQIPQASANINRKFFKLMDDYFEIRSCHAGVSAQVLHGIAKHLKTTQDHLKITDKTSAEWARLQQPVHGKAENAAALALYMDGALSPLPLSHNHQCLLDPDIGACSTLDFALRIMVPNFQMHKWHLRERKTIAAAVGRTYSESRLWDEEGTLIAVETQTCILRPKKPKAKM